MKLNGFGRLTLGVTAITVAVTLMCQGCGPGHKLAPAPAPAPVKANNFAWGEEEECPAGTHRVCDTIDGIQHCRCVPNDGP